VQDFQPDLVLVDKKPFGIMHELGDAIRYLRTNSPDTKHVLVLRDILDAPEPTIACLASSHFERDINSCFDLVAVLGTPDVRRAARVRARRRDAVTRRVLRLSARSWRSAPGHPPSLGWNAASSCCSSPRQR
jgi:predicted glycosyltransferase